MRSVPNFFLLFWIFFSSLLASRLLLAAGAHSLNEPNNRVAPSRLSSLLEDSTILVLGCSADLKSGFTTVYNITTNTWTPPRLDNSSNFQHPAVAALNGYVYSIGGEQTDGNTNITTSSVRRLDIFGLPTWSSMARFPTNVTDLAVVALNDMLLAIGGLIGDPSATSSTISWGISLSNATATTHFYIPEQDLWTPGPPLAAARSQLAATILAGAVFAVGGRSIAGDVLNTTERLDPGAGWRTIGSMSSSRALLSTVALNGFVFALGGVDGLGPLALAERYYPEIDLWDTVASMQDARYSFAATVALGAIFVFGGVGIEGPLATAEQYQPGLERWVSLAPTLALAPFGLAAVVLPTGCFPSRLTPVAVSGEALVNEDYTAGNVTLTWRLDPLILALCQDAVFVVSIVKPDGSNTSADTLLNMTLLASQVNISDKDGLVVTAPLAVTAFLDDTVAYVVSVALQTTAGPSPTVITSLVVYRLWSCQLV